MNTRFAILIAVIFAVAAAAYYVLRPAPLSQNGGEPPVQGVSPVIGIWKQYRESTEWFGFSTEYPANWDTAGREGSGEAGTQVTFFPPESDRTPEKSIVLTVANPRLTPALPVLYTYTTVRTVQGTRGTVQIQTRSPGRPGELIAAITTDAYRAEFRFGSVLNPSYESVFDHMVSSFTFTK